MRRRQRGVALITALLILAIATVAATAMLSDVDVAMQRAQILQDSEMAWWYGKGLDAWVAGMLRRPDGNKDPPVDGLGDAWAQPVSFLPFEHGAGRGQVIDMQGLFNLNNLSGGNKQFGEQFGRLVEAVTGSSGNAADVVQAVRQWLLPANAASAAGMAPSFDYESLDPPYQPATQLMHSASELMQIAGVTPRMYEALLPYITAIPPPGPALGSPAAAASAAKAAPASATSSVAGAAAALANAASGNANPAAGNARAGAGNKAVFSTLNVNTAPLPVLLSLSANADAGRMQDFVKERTEKPAKTAEEAMQRLGLSGSDIATTALGVASKYYLLHAEIAVGSDRMALYSVIVRPDNGSPVVIARSSATN